MPIEKLVYGIHDSPFGQMLLVKNDKQALKALYFLGEGRIDARQRLQDDFSNYQVERDQKATDITAKQVYVKNSALKVAPDGTKFQQQVWQALMTIPFGETRSYQQIADSINNPKAVRAVGTAIGKNPVSIIIPCHRVVRATGDIGDYYWGSERKRKILEWERNA